MRTDLELHGALSLADFPELATARVIYSALDLMFFSSREAREEIHESCLCIGCWLFLVYIYRNKVYDYE